MYLKRSCAVLAAMIIVLGTGGAFGSVGSDVFTVSAAAETIDSGKCGENVTWTMDSEGTVIISGTGAMQDFTRSVGENSTIGGNFAGQDNVRKIVIRDGVTSVGSYAFLSFSNLEEVSIAGSVKKINEGAFWNCQSLKKVHMEEGMETIGEFAFQFCSQLTEVNIPNSVKTIDIAAFNQCTELSNVNIPASVTEIGSWAFYLTKWQMAKQAQDPLVIVNGILIDGETCKGKVVIPDTVKKISECAFNECSEMTGVTVPKSIDTISYGAFSECIKLNEVTIPGWIKNVEDYAFESCVELKSVTISEGVQEIGEYAFCNCTKLKNITVPESVTKIGKESLGYYYDEKTEESRKLEGFTITGYKGSAAQKYAQDNGIKFVTLKKQGEPDIIMGDTNGDGDINVTDIAVVASHIKGIKALEGDGLKAADVNADKDVNVTDISMIASHIKGIKALR